jgi:hypothetical protein
MPNAVVKSYAEKTGKSAEHIEGWWKEAEQQAKKKFKKKGPRFWAYVNGIVKRRAGLSEQTTFGEYMLLQELLSLDESTAWQKKLEKYAAGWEAKSADHLGSFGNSKDSELAQAAKGLLKKLEAGATPSELAAEFKKERKEARKQWADLVAGTIPKSENAAVKKRIEATYPLETLFRGVK